MPEPRSFSYPVGGLPRYTELHRRIVAALNEHRAGSEFHVGGDVTADLCCAEKVLAVIDAWNTECVMLMAERGELSPIEPVVADDGT